MWSMEGNIEKIIDKFLKIADIIDNRYIILQNCNLDGDIVFIKNGIDNIHYVNSICKPKCK